MADLVDGRVRIVDGDELDVFRFKELRVRRGEFRRVADDADLEHGLGVSGEHGGEAEHEQEREQDVPAQGRLVADEFHVPRVKNGEKSFHS